MVKETPLIGEMSEGQRGLLPPLRRTVDKDSRLCRFYLLFTENQWINDLFRDT